MRVKLEDVCERGSSNIKQSDIIKMSGNYPIYGASGLAGKVSFYHQEQPYVAVVKDGAGIGRTTLNPAKSSVIGTMQYLIPKKNVLPEYLFYVVSYMHLEKYYTGATIPHIYFKDYKNEEFNLDNIEKQLEIIDVLGRCKKVIEARKQELVELDSLTKARFVEMFGDPVTNPKGLPIVALGELSKLITKGASPSWQGFSYTDDSSQTIFVTSENVREGYIDLSSPKYIEDGFNEKQKRSVIHKGDFLINIVGASIGRAAQFNLDCKANMNQAAALVRVNDSRVRDKYLLTYLNSDRAQRMYDSMKSDTGRANLSLQDISDLLILLPNVEQQIEFEMFANQVDKSKFAVQKTLEQTQTLFDSLMQKYFG